MKARRLQHGAALLAAMLTVALVAALAAAALWQQWRNIEIESAERDRVQSAWILVGALDWSRLILREDARAGGSDNLGEPWATPLAEARLSSFLTADQQIDEAGRDAFVSGRIVDAQSRLNLTNLIDGQKISPQAEAAFAKVFDTLGLAPQQLDTLTQQLSLALDTRPDSPNAMKAPLMPQHVEQLTWLGLDPASVARLKPYVVILPTTSAVNLNTASAEVIYASIPGLDMADAVRLVQLRARAPFKVLNDVLVAMPALTGQLQQSQHGVASRYFLVEGRLRLGQTVVQERSLVQRTGLDVSTIWRERESGQIFQATDSASGDSSLSTMGTQNHSP